MIDYTTAAAVKAYGDIKKVETDAVLAELIPALSRQVDTYCGQVFGTQTHTSQALTAQIDASGILLCRPAVPTISSITAASWRHGRSSTWSEIDTDLLDVEESISGCTVRLLDTDYTAYRGGRVQMRLSYTGGWAAGNIPADFELAVRRLVWWALKQREAPMEKTAMPQLGVVIVPQAWPKDVKQALQSYVKVTP